MVDVEIAVTRLYEDESLTADLYDPEAGQLLTWAEGLVTTWAQQYAREDDFEALFKPLRAYVRRVSLLVGQRDALTAEKRQDVFNKLIENAGEMGVVVAQSAESLSQSLDGMTNEAAVQMFIQLGSARIETQADTPATDLTNQTDSAPDEFTADTDTWMPYHDDTDEIDL